MMYTLFFLLTGLQPSHSRFTLDLVFMPRVCASRPLCVCAQHCDGSTVVTFCVRLDELQGNLMNGRTEDRHDMLRKNGIEVAVFLEKITSTDQMDKYLL